MKDTLTISFAPTASPKPTNPSMASFLASPWTPSSISCSYFVSSMIVSGKSRCPPMCGRGLRSRGDGHRRRLAVVVRLDRHPVTALDGRQRIGVETVDGGDGTRDGAGDVNRVCVLADDAGRAVVRSLDLEQQAE